MKNIFIMFIIIELLLGCTRVNAQGPIVILKTKKQFVFTQNDKILNRKDLSTILKSNPESVKEYSKHHTNETLGAVLGFSSFIPLGVMIAYYTKMNNEIKDNGYTELSDTYAKNGLIAAGAFAALNMIGLPFNLSKKHLYNSINNYNESLKSSKFDNLEINLVLVGDGIGIQLKF